MACDFFTVGLLGSTTAYVLAVIEHGTRRIHIPGVTPHPTAPWATQQDAILAVPAVRRG